MDAQLQRVSEGRPKRLLVFINPFGGVGKAEKVFSEKVKPLFDLAGVACDVVVTERANHAQELIQGPDSIGNWLKILFEKSFQLCIS